MAKPTPTGPPAPAAADPAAAPAPARQTRPAVDLAAAPVPAPTPAPAPAKPNPALRQAWTSAGTGSGVLLVVLLYPAALAVLQHGPAGLGLWFKAKFLNQTPGTVGGGLVGGARNELGLPTPAAPNLPWPLNTKAG